MTLGPGEDDHRSIHRVWIRLDVGIPPGTLDDPMQVAMNVMSIGCSSMATHRAPKPYQRPMSALVGVVSA